jgi:hypothetical protein
MVVEKMELDSIIMAGLTACAMPNVTMAVLRL